MHRNHVAILLAVMLLLVAAVPAMAITNGQPDNGKHPYVGILAVLDATGAPAGFCSGSLIAPNVVLTAGHCTYGKEFARVSFDDDVRGKPGTYKSFRGRAFTHPNYNGPENPYHGNGLPSDFYRDVGVVVLITATVSMQHYAQLPVAGLVGRLKNKTAVDFVGYGVQEQVKTYPGQPPLARWVGQGVRMFAQSQLISGNFVNSADSMRLALNASGGSGGACFGDSGGPDLLGGTDTVLAVNSFLTNVNCAGVGYSSRVDIPEVLDWVQGFVP